MNNVFTIGTFYRYFQGNSHNYAEIFVNEKWM